MTQIEALIAELKMEGATTRKVIETIPWDKADWKPHAKSTTLGKLARHLADLLTWTGYTLKQTELDVAAPTGKAPTITNTKEEVLALFDKNLSEALADLASFDDTVFNATWTLKAGPQTFFTLPKPVVMRQFIFSHLIHHRGQLDVYLRLNDVPLIPIYGPTADAGF